MQTHPVVILKSLSLRRFRSYTELEHTFGPGLNVLVGRNGQGKSNLLEAVYLLAASKSMRGSRDVDMIQWDAPAAVVSGEVLREKTNDTDVEVGLSRAEKKSLVVNTVRVRRASEFVGQFKAVSFSTADLEIVRGEPACRRRFLDLEISQLSPSYCHALGYYRKVVEQRNRLLKSMKGTKSLQDESLAAWTDQLVQYGTRLMERRGQFLEQLQVKAQAMHTVMAGEGELLQVAYQPSFRWSPGPEETAEAFRRALGEVRHEELRRQMSLVGPHRDDITVLINGRDARTYASQGQQRTAALSLKLAEVELMTELADEPPACVLDDVLSELDAPRRSHVFDIVLDRCQTFLSTTDEALVPDRARSTAALWEVSASTLIGAVGG